MSTIQNAILDDVKQTLLGIEGMKNVYRWGIPDPTQQSSYPYAIVTAESEKYDQLNTIHLCSMSVTVDVVGRIQFTDDDEVGAYVCDLLASIKDAIMADERRGTTDGCPNAISTRLASSTPVVNFGAKPNVAVSLSFDVQYRTRVGDSSSQMP